MSEPLLVRALYPSLEVAEDGILAALAADAAIVAYAADVQPFQGTLAQALAETSFRDPAILVLFAGADIDPLGMEIEGLTCEWHILVRSRNLRGNTPRQAPAAPTEVGTYQMVVDVLRVLTHRTLDLDGMGELLPANIELLTASANADRTQSAYLVTFRATQELRVADADDDLLETSVVVQPLTHAGDNAPLTVDVIIETGGV